MLEEEQIYFKCEDDFEGIKAGSPITLWENGSNVVQVSDWSDPKNIRFRVVTIVDYTVTFPAGTVRLQGYIEQSDGSHIRIDIDLTLYKI